MTRTFEKIYAGLLAFSVRAWKGDAQTASVLTASALGGAMALNALVGFVIAFEVTGVRVAPLAGAVFSLLLVAIPAAIVNRAFLRDNRYELLAREFISLSASVRRRYTAAGAIYLMLSYGGAILFGYYISATLT